MKVCLIGDSNVAAFRLNDPRVDPCHFDSSEHFNCFKSHFSTGSHECLIATIGSATAQYLERASSSTGAGRLVSEVAQEAVVLGFERVCLCFGRVDLNFVWAYQSVVNNLKITVDQYIELVAYSYMTFIIRLMNRVIKNKLDLIVLGIPLPLLSEKQMLRKFHDERRRKDVEDKNLEGFDLQSSACLDAKLTAAIGSLRFRTDLVRRYNARLADLAMRIGIRFENIAETMLDPSTGMSDTKYVRGEDHHPNPVIIGPLWLDMVTAG